MSFDFWSDETMDPAATRNLDTLVIHPEEVRLID